MKKGTLRTILAGLTAMVLLAGAVLFAFPTGSASAATDSEGGRAWFRSGVITPGKVTYGQYFVEPETFYILGSVENGGTITMVEGGFFDIDRGDMTVEDNEDGAIEGNYGNYCRIRAVSAGTAKISVDEDSDPITFNVKVVSKVSVYKELKGLTVKSSRYLQVNKDGEVEDVLKHKITNNSDKKVKYKSLYAQDTKPESKFVSLKKGKTKTFTTRYAMSGWNAEKAAEAYDLTDAELKNLKAGKKVSIALGDEYYLEGVIKHGNKYLQYWNK